MTHQPEMRFKCDRRAAEETVSMNEQPGNDRARPPQAWLAFWIVNTTAPATHFCPKCAHEFNNFVGKSL